MTVRDFGTVQIADAITNLDDDRLAVDWSTLLVGLLHQGWDNTNTANKNPVAVDEASRIQEIEYNRGTSIGIYLVNAPEEPVYLTYSWQSVTPVVTLDIQSGDEKENYTRMVEEARRVILNSRTDAITVSTNPRWTGRVWFQYGSRNQSFEDSWKNQFRSIVDVVIHWRYRRIQV